MQATTPPIAVVAMMKSLAQIYGPHAAGVSGGTTVDLSGQTTTVAATPVPTPRLDVDPATTSLAVRARTDDYGVIEIYRAKTRQGGWCWVIWRGDRPSGECFGAANARTVPVTLGISESQDAPGTDLIDGHTRSPEATALRVTFRSGATRKVPVRNRFFAFELGADHGKRSSDPAVRVDVLGPHGATIATRSSGLRLGG
jgi:hypothetical protein